MSRRDRLVERPDRSERPDRLARREYRDVGRELRRYRRRRRRGTAARVLRAILWLAITTAVLVPAMIASGFLLGPSATEGLITAPLVLIASWAIVLYLTLGSAPKSPTVVVKNNDLPRLPERTLEWLEFQARSLPYSAQTALDSLTAQLESLTPQVEGLDPQQPAAVELRRLLGEELPELVKGYQRVPRKLQTQPSHGGTTPEHQLAEGLSTIDQQLARIHERLAAEDLRALAAHKRYLELKYDKDDELK